MLRLLYYAMTTMQCYDYSTMLRLVYYDTSTALCCDYYTMLRLHTIPRLLYYAGGVWVRPAFQHDYFNFSSVFFLLIGICKADRGQFWRSNLKSVTRLAQGGSHVRSSGNFQYSHQMLGQRSSSKCSWFGESETRPAQCSSHFGARLRGSKQIEKWQISEWGFYSGNYSHITGDYFTAIPSLPAPI